MDEEQLDTKLVDQELFIERVFALMKDSDISEFEFESEGLKLRISSSSGSHEKTLPAVSVPIPQAPAVIPGSASSSSPEAEGKGVSFVKSPMVGTFYSAASPETPPFVKVGDKVTSESIVCIIEAMKVMNEIQPEVSGTIVEILVENGEAVEYGQPLFKMETV